MYNFTRQEAANKLGISTRTIDRYVKSGKIRAKKEGKIIYLNSEDLTNLNRYETKKQEVIIEKPIASFRRMPIKREEKQLTEYGSSDSTLNKIYEDLRNEIKDKEKIIIELSMKVGQAEEVVKNSVSLIDYKKSQLLLEESRTNLNQAIIDLETDKEQLERELKHQKTNNIIMLIALVVLFAIAGTLFLLKI